jgi:amino acid adenylation domain-containing protein
MDRQPKTGEGSRTLRQLIDLRSTEGPAIPFLVAPETGRTLTFAGLQAQSRALYARLKQEGLAPGDKIAFLMDNGLFTAQLFLGVMYSGFVAVPLNVRAGVSQLSYTLNHCDAKVIFVEEQYQALLKEVMTEVPHAVRVLAVSTDDVLPETASATEPPSPNADDIALLMYTSGSTGQPKAAIHTHSTILAQARNSVLSHELKPTDRSLLVLPLYHINAECVTLVPTLLSGGRVIVPHKFVVSHFWDWLDEHRITWSALVPTIISQLLDWKDPKAGQRSETFARIRFLRSSSAPLSPALHREFIEKFKLPLIQAMGCSEGGNVFSNPCPPGVNKIGSPGLPWGFENRIVDSDGNDVPQGEPGEILLRGPALSPGYWKEPEMTKASFDAEGWFHTGDLAYKDEDGYYFVIGRSKELIIKGGMNIAPKQIDEALESHPAVLEAAAVGVPDRYVGEDLVAFAVLRSGMSLDEKELLSFCENHLGHFKTPTRIYFVSDLPKGPSGKVQRLRLVDEAVRLRGDQPAPAAGAPALSAEEAKKLPVEQIIIDVWSDLLPKAKGQITAPSNFFGLGGHSILAIQCLSRLREKLPVMLSLSDFFKNATVGQLAALVREKIAKASSQGTAGTAAAAPQAIPPRDRTKPCPLSPAQQRLWFLEQFNPEVPLYNESEAARLKGKLDIGALEKALNLIVARHEVLRSTIEVVNDNPVLVARENLPLKLKRIDLRDRPATEREAEIERLLIEEPRARYHLETEPGIRATLVELGPEENVFFVMMHHIICDRLSLGVLWNELRVAYDALFQGKSPQLPALPIQYGDYAAWQQQQIAQANFDDDLKFWKENLLDAPSLLDLPLDRPRPPVASLRGIKRRFHLGSELANSVRALAQQEKASLFNVFTAAWNALMQRYTGQDDVLIGIPIADRDRPELQPMIGFFIDTQALRTNLADDPSFREVLSRVQQSVVDVYSHKALPFAQVVDAVKPERNLSYTPLFQVMLNWRDRDAQFQFIGLPGVTIEPLLSQTHTSKFDITVFLTDTVDDIWMEVEYNTDLFNDDRIERMAGHLRTVLAAAAANPAQKIASLPVLTEAERDELLHKWNRTASEYPRDKTIRELVEAQVEKTPDAVALVFEDQELTYRELNARANQLAHHLQKLGVGPDFLVGIYVERSLEMVIGILGILKAGGAYLPLDPSYPNDRIAFMLEDSAVRILLTQDSLAGKLPASSAKIIHLDTGWPEIAKEQETNPANATKPTNLGYVIYTSGSTGKPKGVQLPQDAFVNFLYAMLDAPGLSADDTLMAITTLSFDIAGLELWLPLIIGAKIIIAKREVAQDSRALAELLERTGATVMQATASTYRLLLAGGWKGSPRLKLLCGGEPWPPELAEQLLQRCDSLWNMYGPTETTVWSAVSKIRRGEEVLIGGPIANTQLYVVDKQLQLMPLGVPGELLIGGDGLAVGYLNRPELTAERFPADTFRNVPGARVYRTGDLVRLRPNGLIEFMGRLDNQVKMRGHRIELGEIEAGLTQHPSVKSAAVLVLEDASREKRLVAYVVPDREYKDSSGDSHDSQHVEAWQTLWENAYTRDTTVVEDPLANTAGWLSSYDGQPIPQEQMREWLDVTIERILSYQPERVLDLGCGMGMYLLNIAPRCVHYTGIDISPAALAYVRGQLEARQEDMSKVTLLQRPVDQLDDLTEGSVDTVILNSVAQYFPSIDYFVKVVEQAVRKVKPGGRLFLGDLRSLDLLKAFCASIELHQAPDDLPASRLEHRIRERVGREEELLISPEIFGALRQHLPGINKVEIRLKRGQFHNEMTLFRYDAILHVGPATERNEPLQYLDWEKDQLSAASLRSYLGQNLPRALYVRGIPNARLQREIKLFGLLESANPPPNVADLRASLADAAVGAVEPEDIWTIEDKLPYNIRLTWADSHDLSCFDALFLGRGADVTDICTPGSGASAKAAKPWKSFANDPLAATFTRKLIPGLREYLRGKMPEYMVPSDFVVLDEMPLTPNGKLNRKALPAPNFGRSAPSLGFTAATTPLEQTLSEIWAKELGLAKVSVNDNFFDLGGHSLLMVHVQSRLNEALKTNVSIVELFQYPTIRSLAAHLANAAPKADRLPKIQDRAGKRAEALNRQRQKRARV